MGLFDFFLLSFACFRLTRLLVSDEITEFIRKPFHEIVEEELSDGTIEEYIEVKGKGVRRFFGELLSCYWCTGIWCAVILYTFFYFFKGIALPIISILAIAGAAAIVETIIRKIMNDI